MKRSLTLSAALVLSLMLAGCGGEEAPPVAGDDAASAPAAAAVEPDGASGAGPDAEPEPAAADAADAAPSGSALLDPTHPDANRRAPDRYRVVFATTKGEFVVEVHRDWAPHGADRFYNLVRNGYYDGNRFFRVVDGFVAQFGMNGDPGVNEAWDDAAIPDDPDSEMNTRGRLTFAHAGPNTRTTQLFINLADNLNLDTMGFPPFGEIVDGFAVVQSLHTGYGDGPPYGAGPDQGRIGQEGNTYLAREFPLLDYVETARVVGEG